MEKLIGGILARYVEAFGVELLAYSVLGNHIHLLVRAPNGNLDEFCENVNREVARRVNWLNKRKGKFWHRRYDALEVKSEEDLLDAFLYVSTNPTKHGLVRDSRDWPGLISFQHALTGSDRRFSFQLYSEERVTHHKLKLTPLPQYAKISQKKRRKELEKLLEERMERLARERKENGQGFLGLSTILAQEPGAIPQNVSHAPRPSCFSKCPILIAAHNKAERLRRQQYELASMRYRLGLEADFPKYTFKPPTHRKPRIIPFQPLTPDFFKNAA